MNLTCFFSLCVLSFSPFVIVVAHIEDSNRHAARSKTSFVVSSTLAQAPLAQAPLAQAHSPSMATAEVHGTFFDQKPAESQQRTKRGNEKTENGETPSHVQHGKRRKCSCGRCIPYFGLPLAHISEDLLHHLRNRYADEEANLHDLLGNVAGWSRGGRGDRIPGRLWL